MPRAQYYTAFSFSLMALLTVGCGAQTPATEAVPDGPEPAASEAPEVHLGEKPRMAMSMGPMDPCDEAVIEANAAISHRETERAVALLDEAWGRCGDGHDILGTKAYALAESGDTEGAADLVIEELAQPPASDRAFQLLADLHPKLSKKTRTRIAAMGASAENPIAAPSMAAEFIWAAHIKCGGSEPVSFGQGEMEWKGRKVELLTFECEGGANHDVYFFPPPDPLEQMFKDKLGD